MSDWWRDLFDENSGVQPAEPGDIGPDGIATGQVWDRLLKRLDALSQTSRLREKAESDDGKNLPPHLPYSDPSLLWTIEEDFQAFNMFSRPDLLPHCIGRLRPEFFEDERMQDAIALTESVARALLHRDPFLSALGGPVTVVTQHTLDWLEKLSEAMLLLAYRDFAEKRYAEFLQRGADLFFFIWLVITRLSFGMKPADELSYHPYDYAWVCMDASEEGILDLAEEDLAAFREFVRDWSLVHRAFDRTYWGVQFEELPAPGERDAEKGLDYGLGAQRIIDLFSFGLPPVYQQGIVELMSLALLTDETLEHCGKNPKLRGKIDRNRALKLVNECEKRVGGFDLATQMQKDLLECYL